MNLARLYESFTFWNKLPKINHDILLFLDAPAQNVHYQSKVGVYTIFNVLK